MQHIENDMDDLFRNASEKYRLKPAEDNWDKIKPQLTEKPGPVTTNTKKTGRLLIIGLLIILSVGGFIKYYHDAAEIALHKPLTKNIDDKTSAAEKKPSEKQKSISKKQNKQSLVTGNEYLKQNKFAISSSYNTKQYGILMVDNNAAKELFTALKNDTAENLLIEKIKTADDKSNQHITEKMLQSKAGIQLKENNSINSSIRKNKLIINEMRQKFYLAIIAGPSYNQVKYQGFEKPGFAAGIKAGYYLNKRIAVEAGFLFSKKNYSSDGKYFSMKHVGASMPQGMEVLSLKGSSSIFEIPVHLKYDLMQKNKSNVFLSAGISSYILTNEKNNYHTMLNGVKQDMTSVYKKSRSYFAASIDASAGYEYKINNYNTIRFQPYIQIPFKGTGVGSMPVMSAGVHFGFTHFTR